MTSYALHHKPRPLTLETIIRVVLNPNAYVLFAPREAVLYQPTHFLMYSEFYDSIATLRWGFKPALKPYNWNHLKADDKAHIEGLINKLKEHNPSDYDYKFNPTASMEI